MAGMQYEGWVNPYGANMAETIARSADAEAHASAMTAAAAARAAEIRANAYGGAVQSIAQIPAQIEAQKSAAIDRKLKQEQLAQSITQRQEDQRQKIVTTIGRMANGSTSAEDFVGGINDMAGLGAIPKDVAAHIAQQVQAAGPEAWDATKAKYVEFGSTYEQAIKLGEKERLVKPGTGKEIVPAIQEPIKLTPGQVAVQPGANGAPATTVASAPFAPGTGQHVVNGQVLDATGAAVGAPVPKQETPSEAAVNTARVTELQAQVKKIDAELSGTMPVSPTDKLRLELERQKVGNELEHYRMTEAREDPATPKNQEKFEQQYRGVLTRVLSSRSGGMGLEDAKVNQAKHLIALFDQTKNAKGEYEIPRVMQTEIAMGLARLVSPTGVVGEGTLNEINQKTAKGDLAGTLTYLTGHPFTGSTQEIFKMYRDSIERQGKVAQDNRESYLESMRSFAPTDLSEERRTKLEKGLQLNRLDAGGGGTISVTDPLGGVHTFPDQAAADAFKAKAGIK